MTEYNLTDNLTLSITPALGATLVELWEWNEEVCDWKTIYSRLHMLGTHFEYALDALCVTFPDVPAEAHECTLNFAGLDTEWADDYA